MKVNAKEIKILYFGTPEMSAKLLELFINDGFNIVGVVAQEDKPVGRKNLILPVPTKTIANKYNIPVYQPHKIKDMIETIKNIKPDLILTFAYGQIIPLEILKIPTYRSLNLHGSLLPKYRGAAPIQYALINGDKTTGVTLMEMVSRMDAGRMYHKELINIDDNDNFDTLTNKIIDASFTCFKNGIDSYLDGSNVGIEQDESEASFTNKIDSDFEYLDFNNSSFSLINKIRALSTVPGSKFVYEQSYKVFEAHVGNSHGAPGKILDYSKNGLEIATLDGSIIITIIQKPGKSAMGIKDFYNGNQNLFKKGEIIK